MRIWASMVAMSPAANPDDPADLAALAGYADALLAAIDVALPAWVQRAVAHRWSAGPGGEVPPAVGAAARDAAASAHDDLMPKLRALLSLDVGAQRTNPLAILRGAVVYPSRVLAGAGIAPVERDPRSVQMFPDDVFDLTPASFADLDPSVHEPGIHWGAAKAHVLMRRRRA